MKDWLFFPLIAVMAGAMIFIALSFGDQDPIDPSQGIIVRGASFDRLVVGAGNQLEIIETADGQVARMSSNLTPEEAPSAGIFLAIPEFYHEAYDGQELVFSLRVRTAAQNGNQSFQTGFFAPASSKWWQTFELTSDFQDFEFSHRAVKSQDKENFFYFGIWPDAKGQGRQIDVLEMSVKPKL